MHLDDHPDGLLDTDDDLALEVDDDGEWLGSLRRAGLPVRPEVSSRPGVVVEDGVAALVGESWAASTRRAYESSWLRFGAWCYVRGLDDPLDAGETEVAAWVAAHVEQGLTAAYLRRQLAALANAFELAGRPSPTRHPLVKRTVAGAHRRLGTTQHRAPPLGLDELRRVVTTMWVVDGRPHSHPAVRRDRALLLLGWAAALRASELVALDVADVAFDGDPDGGGDGGLLVRVRRSKTDVNAGGAHVAVPYARHLVSCPVRATMLLARERRTGALFRRIDRHGRIGGRLSPEAVTDLLRRRLADLGEIDPALYSSHSLRAGFVTEMRARSVPDHLIARHTRHRDLRMLEVYDRPTDLFRRPRPRGGVVVTAGDAAGAMGKHPEAAPARVHHVSAGAWSSWRSGVSAPRPSDRRGSGRCVELVGIRRRGARNAPAAPAARGMGHSMPNSGCGAGHADRRADRVCCWCHRG